MKILHGEDLVTSRNQLVESLVQAKLAKSEIIQLNGKKCSLTEIKQALESQSLFQQQKLIIIQNFFSRPDSKQKKQITDYLAKTFQESHPSQPQLIIWEGKTITPAQLKKFPSNTIQEFKIPSIIFQFLDQLAPRNSKTNLKLLHQVLNTQPPEMIFGMIIKRLRYLIVSHSQKNSTLQNFKELRAWQIKRIQNQTKKFTLTQLKTLQTQFLNIDYLIKTGQTNLTLTQHIEQTLTKL